MWWGGGGGKSPPSKVSVWVWWLCNYTVEGVSRLDSGRGKDIVGVLMEACRNRRLQGSMEMVKFCLTLAAAGSLGIWYHVD